jgi:hypothetical protein
MHPLFILSLLAAALVVGAFHKAPVLKNSRLVTGSRLGVVAGRDQDTQRSSEDEYDMMTKMIKLLADGFMNVLAPMPETDYRKVERRLSAMYVY